MSIRVAATGEGSGDERGFISGCIVVRKTSSFFFFLCFNTCKTRSEEEKCKEINWDLESFEDGKQNLNL